ncbi:MAG: TlpA family protein disulfide reductase [Crocinitomicaceae bacterium]|nr:TlpA family protein disulfide reductase [Crocinitomicaceae bacterium]
MIRVIFTSLFFSYHFSSIGQVITGNLSLLPNQYIYLEGFNGFKTCPIDSTHIDTNGNFQLHYSTSDYGVGYLISTDNKPLVVILSGENIVIQGEALSYVQTIRIVNGKENQWFERYAQEHPKREQALSAWLYLSELYYNDSLFALQGLSKKAITEEVSRIKAEDTAFLESLPKNSYVRWFLPVRKLVSSVSEIAQNRPQEISTTIKEFREMDYTDSRLYKSGLFKDVIESHFWLLENSSRSLDSIFIEMKISIDAMMVNLVKDEKKLNEVTDHLFNLLEIHSLFQASEYLALKVLNETSCTIDNDLANQLETYRTMKIGNIAPDIQFKGDHFAPNFSQKEMPKKLSYIKSKYTVVVFGASWCPKCREEIPEIISHYKKWKEQDVEVVFVSLDEDKIAYSEFVKYFPFISTCDYQKWDSPIVKDFHVFGTPTMYLLDEKREIILRPNSVKQMNAWVDWFLVQGNK